MPAKRMTPDETIKKLNVAIEARLEQIDLDRNMIDANQAEEEDGYNGLDMKSLSELDQLSADERLAAVSNMNSRRHHELDHEVIEIKAMRAALRRNAGLVAPEVAEVKALVADPRLRNDIIWYRERIAMSSQDPDTQTRCITNCTKCITDCTVCITSCLVCWSDCHVDKNVCSKCSSASKRLNV